MPALRGRVLLFMALPSVLVRFGIIETQVAELSPSMMRFFLTGGIRPETSLDRAFGLTWIRRVLDSFSSEEPGISKDEEASPEALNLVESIEAGI